jgi:serine/threonine-protein kinase
LGAATADSEEGRSFLQERLSLYTMWIFILSGGLYALNTALTPHLRILLSHYSLARFGVTVVFGAIWVTTRFATLSFWILRWVDGAALAVAGALFAVTGAGMAQVHVSAGGDPTQALLTGQLACGSTILTRAVAVPSTAERTFWIGLVALVPQVAYSAYTLLTAPVLSLMPGFESTSQMAVGNLLNIVAWSGLALTISTVASSVIFGLRAEADKIRRLGQYTLEEKIGEGGMGIVYRARHALLRRPTAIKLLSPRVADADNVRRFEREVQLTATLTHPSTIAIYDYGRTPSGAFYYAMEYLDGLNLEQLVQCDGPQPAGRVIHILQQVSGALSEAHEVGLIHRDI